MSTGKTYSTKYLLDSNNNRGAAGQVLSTTSTGIDWVDANTVPGTGLWLANGNDIYNSNSGNVGIGTTSPSAALHVYDSSSGEVKFQRATGYSGLLHFGFPSGLPTIRTSGNFAIKASDTWGADLYINSSGNVGIGTTSPGSPLSVVGSYSSSDEIVEIGGGTGINTDFKLKIGAVDQDYIWFQSVKPGDNYYDLVFNPTAGNVGIGVTSPTFKLHVNSNDASDNVAYIHHNNAAQSSGDVLKVRSDAGDNAGSALLNVANNTGSALYVRGDRNVGIGITDPAARLEVKSNLYVSHPNAEEITFRLDNYGTTGTDAGPLLRMFNQSGTTVVNIDSRSGSSRDTYFNQGGNFGIGVTGPSTKLEVAGHVTINSPAGASQTSYGLRLRKTNSSSTVQAGGEILASPYSVNTNAGNLIFKTADTAANLTQRMVIDGVGAIQFNAYDSTNQTGTPTYLLGTDASGNVVKTTTVPGSGAGPYLPLSAGASYPLTGALHTNGTIFMSAGNPGIIMQETDVTDKNWDIQVNGGNLKFYEVNDARSVFSEKVTFEAGGNVGIGTTGPEHKLVAMGTIGFGAGGYNGGVFVNNTSTAVDENWGLEVQKTSGVNDYNTRLKYYPNTGETRKAGIYNSQTSSFSLYSDSNNNPNIIIPDGNVGIGTTTPSKKLEVAGSYKLGTNAYIEYGGVYPYTISTLNTAAVGNLIFTAGSGSSGYESGITLQGSNTASDDGITFTTGSSTAMVIQVNGNVGIGTTSPGAKLDIDDGAVTDIRIRGNQTSDARIGAYNFYNTAASDVVAAISADRDGANDAAALAFDTQVAGGGMTERMRITSTGNVGIGTTSPEAQLELKKQTTWGTLNNQVIYINNTGTGGDTSVLHDMGSITWRSGNVNTAAISGIRNTPGSGNNVDLRFTTATQSGGQQTSMTILSGGNVGIGTTSPTRKLHVEEATTWLARFAYNASNYIDVRYDGFNVAGGAMVFQNAGSEKMRIDTSGNVGIGTTSPGAKLDVAGSINTSGSINLTNAGVNTIAASNPSNGYLKFLVDQQGVALTLNADTTSTFGGRIYAVDGDKATPGYSFASDPDTGMFRDSANVLVLGVNGDTRIKISNTDIVTYKPLAVNTTSITSGVALDVGGVGLIGDSGVGDFYLGNYATANHFRFHTNNSNTYFDMNCGDIYWRQGTSTRYQFFASTANMTIQGTLTQNSDARTKENVIEISDCISKVKAMRGVYYNRTDFNTEVTKVGVIAQEVEAVLPELVLESPETGLKSVAYSELTSVLINAIKEQQEIIEDLKTRIEQLEN